MRKLKKLIKKICYILLFSIWIHLIVLNILSLNNHFHLGKTLKGRASYGGVKTHHEVETVLNALKKDFPVVDINIEFSFESIMHKYAGLNIDIVVFIVPVGLECYRYAVPSLRVVVSESVTHASDDSLGDHMWL